MLYFLGGPFTGANVDLTNAGVTNDVLTVVSPQQYNFQAGGGGGGGSGTVTSVAAGDGTITIGGTPTVAPTVVVTPGVFDAAGAAAAAAAASIPLSTVTTIGDIIAATGSSAVARVANGSSANVLVATTGAVPSWTANPPFPVAVLTDGASVAVVGSSGQVQSLTAVGDRTIAIPSGSANGRRLVLRITASGADRTMTLTTGSTGAFDLGGFIITATLSGTTDYIDCYYDSTATRWRVVNYVKTVLLWTPANTAIPLSTVTTIGDLIYATGNAAVTRLANSSGGNVLQANSGAAPSWQANPVYPVVTLTDGASVAVVAGNGLVQKLTAAGDRTIAIPSGAQDGRRLIIKHTASGGARTLALTTGSSGAFEFGTDITGLTTTGSGLTDVIGCIYDATSARWFVVAYVKGYA